MPSIDEDRPDPKIPGKIIRGHRSMGATSAFAFGGAYHSARVIAVGLGYEPFKVEPVTWKRTIGIQSRDPATGEKRSQREVKEIGRQKAIARFANGAGFFPNIGHHNRAEAALIALFGLYYFAGDAVHPHPKG